MNLPYSFSPFLICLLVWKLFVQVFLRATFNGKKRDSQSLSNGSPHWRAISYMGKNRRARNEAHQQCHVPAVGTSRFRKM